MIANIRPVQMLFLDIQIMDMQQQSWGDDCRVLAISSALCLCGTAKYEATSTPVFYRWRIEALSIRENKKASSKAYSESTILLYL